MPTTKGLPVCRACGGAATAQPLLDQCRSSNDMMVPALGVHPMNVSRVVTEDTDAKGETSLTVLDRMLTEGRAKGSLVHVGETGLDGRLTKGLSAEDAARERESQEHMFSEHCRLAVKHQCPVQVHIISRKPSCWPVLTATLQRHTPPAVVLHAYSGSLDNFVQVLMPLNCYLSVAPFVLDKTAKKMRRCARECPLDRLLIETDMDDAMWTEHRGEGDGEDDDLSTCVYQCHSSLWDATVAEVAMLRGMDPDQVAQACRDNLRRVLGMD
ncbi:TatD family protein [Kipferlia bialata]|uniref:TatD family protein n=1 Tax=Kipferlia bialata TaxID=797122 RepID=A0A9K3CWI3_9EUKA|nr:TatD family protein [Kipferlia bialata]|eukprot:g6075.t1